jgi:hypothetical protein
MVSEKADVKSFLFFLDFLLRLVFLVGMKIKQRNKSSKKNIPHWWLLPKAPKKSGRLAQLSKHNHKVDSELVRAAKRSEGVR